jgi:putative heme-binding domain-containing protein
MRYLSIALLLVCLIAGRSSPADSPWETDRLVAWCIVPFDAAGRGPEQRAVMLRQLGLRRLAYDYRAEHVPTFSEELDALQRHQIELTAWWFPPVLNEEARAILALLEERGLQTQLWVSLQLPAAETADQQRERIVQAADMIRPVAEAAGRIGCSVGLYNHGSWFGEPDNQIAIIEHLQLTNVGIVYNQHHGHEHVADFAALLARMQPYLLALNLNGMQPDGPAVGQKILPIGAGSLDRQLIEIIRRSGYDGPIGILDHSEQHDAQQRLSDNLIGLRWVLSQLEAPAGSPLPPRPEYQTWDWPADADSSLRVPAAGGGDELAAADPAPPMVAVAASPDPRPLVAEELMLVGELLAAAHQAGDGRRGLQIFADHRFGCGGCHRVAGQGGAVGPDLSDIGVRLSEEQIAASILWPNRHVDDHYRTAQLLTDDGELLRGYIVQDLAEGIRLRDPSTGTEQWVAADRIEARSLGASLMPEGLLQAMNAQQQADLLRFIVDLGRSSAPPPEVLSQRLAEALRHAPAEFPYEKSPLDPEVWPHWKEYVNRDRLYDFYTKQADHFRGRSHIPALLAPYPGIDGGDQGHWGNQNEATWASSHWTEMQFGPVQSGIFQAEERQIRRSVCFQLGGYQPLAVCFNTESLRYEAAWSGGFLKVDTFRHGFLSPLRIDGQWVPLPEPLASDPPGWDKARQRRFLGFFRVADRVVLAYKIDAVEYLEVVDWVNGRPVRLIAPRQQHPWRDRIAKGSAGAEPESYETAVQLGEQAPYAIDTIELPWDNRRGTPLFIGDVGFLSDGSAVLCTMPGEVWRVDGFAWDPATQSAGPARWQRIADGLFQALGVVVDPQDRIFVLGRDQITELIDIDGDGVCDWYGCFSQAFETSLGGHDYLCGLERDAQGRFYLASSNQGLIRISADGAAAEVLATGMRNPDGIGLMADGTVTVPCSEGEWTPASTICAIRPSEPRDNDQPPHFGYGGPRSGEMPALPLVYLPRGIDNSSGGQCEITSDRWGPLQGAWLHSSFGTCSHLLLLRDEVDGQLQGGVVPLPGEFRSGAHRLKFHPGDGQLYAVGMQGWGSYGIDLGSFQRVRYTGAPVVLPTGFRVHSNGVRLDFSAELPEACLEPQRHFAQCWNYRYSRGYGSPELSTRHPDTPGHDVLMIGRLVRLNQGRSLFLELPDLQPCSQLHLRLTWSDSDGIDVFLTPHRLAPAMTELPGVRSLEKRLLPHPMERDMLIATLRVENPHAAPLDNARQLDIAAGTNLSFRPNRLEVRAGEPVAVRFRNPDTVPHNWVLLAPGSLDQVGQLVNQLVADPLAAVRHYIPAVEHVLAYTDIIDPGEEQTIYFRAPTEPGQYPFLCSFPGHWMVMNGTLVVSP